MIRLVATDMDGTLLRSDKTLPEAFFGIVRQLPDVRFVIASGRQYYNILKECAAVRDRILVIAENGSAVGDGAGILMTETMDAETARIVSEKALAIPDACFIVCGENCAHIVGDPTDEMLYKAHSYYERVERTDNVDFVLKNDRVLKIAVYSHKRAQELLLPTLEPLNGAGLGIRAILSGQSWVDVMNQGVNKGLALQRIQQKYGISSEETMAFGDYLNDRELLSVSGGSYAMANAHPDLIRIARHLAPSNDEDGVVQVLKETFGL